MAETKLIYSIKINGVEQQINNVKTLNSEINNLGDSVNDFSTNSIDQTSASFDNLSKSVDNVSTEFDSAGNSVDNFNNKVTKIDDSGLKKFDKSAKSTTEKIDKLTFAGEKGFKGISDALKLFGVDTSILDNVKEGLGAIGDLLDSQSKVNEVAHNSAPAAKQAQTIKELASAQQAATTATEAGAVATTAQSTATKGATIATNIFNAALKALPFIAVIAAITTVIALYSQWKESQDELAQSADDFIKKLNDDLELYNQSLEDRLNLLNSLNDEANNNLNLQIANTQKEIQLLEAQEGSIQSIYNLKKKLIELQQKQSQNEIENSKNEIKNYDDKIIKNKTLIDQSYEKIKNAKNQNDIDLLNNEINKLRKEGNSLEKERSKLILDNNKKQIDLNLSKEYDIKLLNAANEKEKERLEIQKQQKLNEIKEKQIDYFINIINDKEEIRDFIKNIQEKFNDNKFKIYIDTKNFGESFDILLEKINNFNDELVKKQEEISKDIQNKQLNIIENQTNLALTDFEKVSVKLNKAISEENKNSINSILESVGNFTIFNDQKKEDIKKYKQSIESIFENVFGKNDKNYINELNNIKSSIDRIVNARKEYNEVSTNSSVIDLAYSEVLNSLLTDTKSVLTTIEGIYSKSFDDVNNTVEDLSKKLDKEKPFDFSLLFDSKNLKKQLKDSVNQPAEEAILSLQKEIQKVNTAFNNIAEIDPALAEKLQPVFAKIISELDNGIASIEKKAGETNNNIDSVIDVNIQKQVGKFFDYAQQISDFYSMISEIQIINLEAEQERINENFDLKQESLDKELEILQQYYDAQVLIAQDANSKINDFENQLVNARGARAEFLLKLLATEQEKAQKAQKAKEDAAKKEKKLKDEQIKQEKERTAELEKIEQEKARIRKRAALISSIIDAARAFLMALLQPPGPPETITQAVIAGALATAQVAVIAASKYKEGGIFKKGGMLNGNSHQQGGMPVYDGNGKKVAELEGGEFIIRKSIAEKNINLLKQINSGKINSEGIMTKVSSANQVQPNYNTIQSAIDNNNSTNTVQVTIDNESIKQAIKDGMNNVIVQASIIDIIEHNKKQIVINDLRKV